MAALRVLHIDVGPRWGQENVRVVAILLTERVQNGFAGQFLECRCCVDQATTHCELPRGTLAWSSSATSMARRRKAVMLSHGRACPREHVCSCTMRRPGSSTTAYPRCWSSASKVDLPPPEQPEMMMKWFIVSVYFSWLELAAQGNRGDCRACQFTTVPSCRHTYLPCRSTETASPFQEGVLWRQIDYLCRAPVS